MSLQFTATEIQDLYQQIAKIHQAGVTTEHDYQFQLEIYKFQDTEGTYWTLGVQSGAWYYHNDTDWIRAAQPPTGLLAPANLFY
jgi:hypothetical protein